MENQQQRTAHWDFRLMAIDPKRIARYSGIIAGTMLGENNTHDALLEIKVKRNKDQLLGGIILTFSKYDFDGEERPVREKDRNRLPEVIRRVYSDFNVSDASQLVNKPVIGLYFGNSLVGFKRE